MAPPPPPYAELDAKQSATVVKATVPAAAAVTALTTDDAPKTHSYVWCLPKNAPRTWKEARTPFECGFCKKEVDALTKVGDALRWCNACRDTCTICPKCKQKSYWTDHESKAVVVIPANTRAQYSAYQDKTGVYYTAHGCVSCNFVKALIPCGLCTVPSSRGKLVDGLLEMCADCEYAERHKPTQPAYSDPGYATDCVVCGIGQRCMHGEKM
jgi:hypothetical protein